MTGRSEHNRAEPGELIWAPFGPGSDAEGCDLTGHFWATIRPDIEAATPIWSWMIIGYEGQLLAAGQAGDAGAAKRLIEEWDRWICGPNAVLDSTDNPPAIAEDHLAYAPVWPRWEWQPPPT